MSTLARLCGAASTEEIPVDFTVECDDFTVPERPELRCSATFRVCGDVTIDHSGDHVTPDGPPSPDVMLMDPTAFQVLLCRDDLDVPLPEWLQERLLQEDADEFDAAFLAAIGGQSTLDERAVEEACG